MASRCHRNASLAEDADRAGAVRSAKSSASISRDRSGSACRQHCSRYSGCKVSPAPSICWRTSRSSRPGSWSGRSRAVLSICWICRLTTKALRAAIQIFDPELEKSELSSDPPEPSPFPTYGYVALTRFAAAAALCAGTIAARSARCGARTRASCSGTADPWRTGDRRTLVAWRAGDLYLTAVKLRNATSRAG